MTVSLQCYIMHEHLWICNNIKNDASIKLINNLNPSFIL